MSVVNISIVNATANSVYHYGRVLIHRAFSVAIATVMAFVTLSPAFAGTGMSSSAENPAGGAGMVGASLENSGIGAADDAIPANRSSPDGANQLLAARATAEGDDQTA